MQPSQNFTETGETTIDLAAPVTSERLVWLFSQNDSGWYFGIASDGYEQRPFEATHQANWAFFPLTPIIWNLLGADSHAPFTAVAASNIFFGLGLFLLLVLMCVFGFVVFVCVWAVVVVFFFFLLL